MRRLDVTVEDGRLNFEDQLLVPERGVWSGAGACAHTVSLGLPLAYSINSFLADCVIPVCYSRISLLLFLVGRFNSFSIGF